VGETSANNKKSSEDLINLLDLKPGGTRYEITTWVAKKNRYFQWPLPSWIRSKRATKGCNRHAEQERVYTKVYMRVENFHVTRAQV